MGHKIEQTFLMAIELAFCLSYLPLEKKIPFLNKTITRIDILKFFTQLAWENKLIPTDKFSELVLRLEEIGRQLGGWKKGIENRLENKTPQA